MLAKGGLFLVHGTETSRTDGRRTGRFLQSWSQLTKTTNILHTSPRFEKDQKKVVRGMMEGYTLFSRLMQPDR
jgi:hypothetical protein